MLRFAAEKFRIPKEEVPFMISEDLHIITIPKEKDPPIILWSGDRGCGKTNSYLAYICNMYHKQSQYIFIANDHANLSHAWNKPCNYDKYIKVLDIVGIKPRGIPIVQLYPSRKNFVPPIEYDIDYIKIALSWDKILDNYREFFELGGSEKYFEQLIPLLKRAKTSEQIKDIVSNAFGSTDSDNKVKNKIIALIEQVWKSKIIDIDDDVVSAIKTIDKFEIKKEFTVVTGLLYAGAIPTLLTSSLTKNLMDIYLNNELANIFETQSSPSWFRDNRKTIYICIDELQVLEKRFKETRETLDMIALEGRNVRIGLLYCAQNIASIPDDMADNTRYAICLNQSGEKDINKLRALFNLSKRIVNEIKTLNKDMMEVIACSKEKFNSYDLETGKKSIIRNEPIRGKYLPPQCRTIPPIE